MFLTTITRYEKKVILTLLTVLAALVIVNFLLFSGTSIHLSILTPSGSPASS